MEIKPIAQFEVIEITGFRREVCNVQPVRKLEDNYKEAIEALTSVCKDYTEHDTEKIRCIIEKAYKYAWEDIRREK